VVRLADVPDWLKVKGALLGQVQIEEGCGAVSVVGDFVGRNAAKLARMRSVPAGMNIAIKAMATSPLRATLFCADGDVDELARALHKAFRE
jgi:aspartokinase